MLPWDSMGTGWYLDIYLSLDIEGTVQVLIMDIYQRLDIEGTVQVLMFGYILKIGYWRDCTGFDIWIYIKDWILKGLYRLIFGYISKIGY